MSELNTDIVGKTIQNYKIIRPIGQGKFSTVYQAERLSDQKLVAMKIIKVLININKK
jgi:serine/threonine protein kinase